MMDNITEINKKLDAFYDEYIKRNILSDIKTNEVVLLLAKISGDTNSNTKIIAEQLSRFSAKVCQMYFDNLTKKPQPSILVIDDLLKDFFEIANSSKQPQHHVRRFADTIIPVIKNRKSDVFESKMLSSFVAFIARFAANSPSSSSYKESFQNMVNKTDGAIYLLDYTNVNNELMENIWKVTNDVFPDLTKAKYESFILEWAAKYGFITSAESEEPASADNKVKIEESVAAGEMPKEESKASVGETTIVQKGCEQVIYDILKRDMDKQQEAIITAFTDKITPIEKALEAIQGEINKSREFRTENVSLKVRIEDLERQLSEQRVKVQTANRSLVSVRTENEELKKPISSLEAQNVELDSKLNDAYAINSREASLEAEKIRSELKKAFVFLYEDWLEYEFSDVSEENYESLQAIIKKIFRSLERNGIDFKGNN